MAWQKHHPIGNGQIFKNMLKKVCTTKLGEGWCQVGQESEEWNDVGLMELMSGIGWEDQKGIWGRSIEKPVLFERCLKLAGGTLEVANWWHEWNINASGW